MIPLSPLQKLLQQANDFFAQSDVPAEAQAKAKVALHSVLAKLDLVTREEFDAQTAVLQRTRERLEALEQEVEKLTTEK